MHGPKNTPEPEYQSGPDHSHFPHFTENGLPDLFLFLKNAVAEELGYHEARQENFRLYGFAVEYETLAPKLLVVYNADCTIATLLESASAMMPHHGKPHSHQDCILTVIQCLIISATPCPSAHNEQ